jgi:hypothetical protein
VPVADFPENLNSVRREDGRLVLAYGELTGRAHAIKDPRAALYGGRGFTELYMDVIGDVPVALEHDEHDTIAAHEASAWTFDLPVDQYAPFIET